MMELITITDHGFLSFCRNGTSMISLIIPPKDQISRVSKMLADEFGTASNIKSRVNRLSVLGAITSVQQKLKLYTRGESMKQD
jgi:peptide chain release factor subunit 1